MSNKEEIRSLGQKYGLDSTYGGSELESLQSIAEHLGMSHYNGLDNSDTDELLRRIREYDKNHHLNNNNNNNNVKSEIVEKTLKKKLLLIFGPTIASSFLFYIILIIPVFIVIGIFNGDGSGSSFLGGGNTSNGGVCTYDVNGKKVSNVMVRLLNCDGNTAVPGEELIDFETYITGVVYQESGSARYEALKAQAVAARSYALTRPKKMNYAVGINLKEENGQWILSLRSCTNDQVFCNPNKGCWSNVVGGQTNNNKPEEWPNCTVHSGYDTSKKWTRNVLPEDSDVRKAVKETAGQVLVDSKGNIVYTSYVNTTQNRWNELAKDSNNDYFAILIDTYGAGNKISNSNCVGGSGNVNTTIDSAEVADIIKWDQSTAWKNIIGTESTNSRPSVSESVISNRLATVEVPMRKWDGNGNNPLTDTKKVMQKISVNAALAPLWKAFFEDVYENAPDFVIGEFGGCYNYRPMTGSDRLSAHAYGVACDLNHNTSGNGYYDKSYSREKWESLPETRAKYQVIYKDSKVVQIAHKYTLINGSDWSDPHDAMHFSFIGDWTRDRAIKCQNKSSC